MNSPSDDIKDILEAAGLGLTFQTNLFVGTLPAQAQDNCVVVYDTPGWEPDLTFNPDEKYDKPSIQVLVRNRDYRQAYDLVNDIKTELHGLGHEVWNGTTYELVRCSQEPFPLGHDEKNRVRFVCNFDIQRH
jgi:hypothetical protein